MLWTVQGMFLVRDQLQNDAKKKKIRKKTERTGVFNPLKHLCIFLIPYKVNMCKSFLPFCLSFGILRHDISITFY